MGQGPPRLESNKILEKVALKVVFEIALRSAHDLEGLVLLAVAMAKRISRCMVSF